ncbi:CST complex subunit STN1-like [Zootermopsis nevadensis]|uniref:CST complex subunit STN1 n=1 Tax=Zootermopsis nevadensis TaxID=136037 RepID=A0A067QTE1_ZOONE|nr:CST complex subunit STN1-like [Zootermopsis nevadensis]KDR06966.1 hypothetical protein L798_03717 [Zootermopsis nevadensis]
MEGERTERTAGTKKANTGHIYRPATKLWISDCLCVPPYPTVKNTYLFQDFLVEYVDVFGVVSGRKLFGTSAAAYTIDDGTGEITCLFDHGRQYAKDDYQQIVELGSELTNVSGCTDLEHKLLNYMMKPAIYTFENLVQYREVGDTVHVAGRLCQYQDLRQVKAYHLSLITDLNDEVDRIHELMLLYENGYCRSNGSLKQKQRTRV